MLGAAISHPDPRAVIPWMPEPLVQPDGTDNHEGERHATPRFMAKWRQDHPHLTCLVTDDRLSAKAPPIEALQAHGRRDLRGVKDGDQAWLCEPVPAADHAGRVTFAERHDRAAGVVHRGRCVHDRPLKASHPDVRINCIESWEMGATKVQPLSWVTDWRVSTRHVYHLMRGGRARWKIANDTFNTLNNQGDHCEHHDGHGTQHLSVVWAMGMRLACWVDQTPQLCGALLQAVGAKLGSTRLLWERMRAWCYDDALVSMRPRLEALVSGVKTSPPILASDSSSSGSRVPL
jgi:hypothetical protein